MSKKNKTNYATLSLVFGILSLLFGAIPIIGLVLIGFAVFYGLKGLKEEDGKAKAIAGLVMGGISFLFGLIFLISVIVAPEEPSEDKEKEINDSTTDIVNEKEPESSEEEKEAKRLAEEKKKAEELKEKRTFKGTINLSNHDGKLRAVVDTNAPDGTVVDLLLMDANFNTENAFVSVSGGKVAHDFTITNEWGHEGYGNFGVTASVTFNSEEKPQPKEVTDLYGENGEHLLGELAIENSVDGFNAMIQSSTIDFPSTEALNKKRVELFEATLKQIVNQSNGVILDIRPYYNKDEWKLTSVVVGDSWYYSAKHEKERFAEQVGPQIKDLIYKAGLVDEESAVGVFFIDSFGKEVASPKMLGGYKIKE